VPKTTRNECDERARLFAEYLRLGAEADGARGELAQTAKHSFEYGQKVAKARKAIGRWTHAGAIYEHHLREHGCLKWISTAAQSGI
jgi:hypothetical protein